MTILNIIKNGYDKHDTAKLQQSYKEHGYVFLPGFFDSFLVKNFRSLINSSDIKEFYNAQAGDDFKALDYRFNKQLIREYNFLINQKNYIDFLAAVTGDDIGCLRGSFYISDNITNRGYDYHDDDDGNRHFFISVNISEKIFDGGVLALREKDSKKVLLEIQNNNPGGALICRIGENLEHRITSVVGENRRIVLLSWALKEPKIKRYNVYP